MIIAVTGASGSIGRELTPFLDSLGFKVIRISFSESSNGETIFSYDDLINNRIHLKVNFFIHLASHNSSLGEGKIDDEVQLTNNILNAMINLQCKRLIFFSTAKVYGENSEEKYIFDETSLPNPKCSYSKAKKLCEDQITFQAEKGNFNAVILRLPPVLNKSQSSNLGKLMRISKKGFPMISLSQGVHNKRSFISFNNIKTVIESFLRSEDVEIKNEIYNLADDEYVSLNHLLRCHGQKSIYTLPKNISKFIFKIPFLKGFLLKLYGNFMLDNRKLKSHMNVKLTTTTESLSIIYK